jgi:hypothetical protein
MREMRTTVTLDLAIKVAQELRSEDGENPEYDRALVELIRDMFGYLGCEDGEEARALVQALIGTR